MNTAVPRFIPSWESAPKRTGKQCRHAYELDLDTGKWIEKRPMPGVAGRLAASAVALHDQVFIFGGYVIDSQGGETTVPDLNVFVPLQNRYYRGKDIPVPVDDAVIGLYRDRYIFLIGGWSSTVGKNGDAVRNVQVYDTEKDTWTKPRPFPAPPSSATPEPSSATPSSTLTEPTKIPTAVPNTFPPKNAGMGKIPQERRLHKNYLDQSPRPPGNARYRIAAGAGLAERKRSENLFHRRHRHSLQLQRHRLQRTPCRAFARDLRLQRLQRRMGDSRTDNSELASPTMDHRGLLVSREGLVTVGGIGKRPTGNCQGGCKTHWQEVTLPSRRTAEQ